MVIIIIIAIILLILSLKKQKVCSKEGMIQMINDKIAKQKQSIKNINSNFFNKYVSKLNSSN